MPDPSSVFLDEQLHKTSRTFALAIPLLPEPLRREVSVGYLLFRIADTLEDAERLGRDERVQELGRFVELLGDHEADGAEAAALWSRRVPSTNADYNNLLAETPEVLQQLRSLHPTAAEALRRHVVRSTLGMAETLRRSDAGGAFRLDTVEQLRTYCYYVAGIVGEMLTTLFCNRLPSRDYGERLRADAAAFGEGLQLVNILKDAGSDAADGRVYLPADTPREEVLRLAREDLAAAARYAATLQEAGAEPGVVAFATLPRTLAEATLDLIERGDGVKISREVVAALLAEAAEIASRSPGAP